MKSRYLISCAVAAIASSFGHSAFAAAAAAADNASAGPATVEEVIVSANRRDELIQKVPATIQAFSGDSLSKLNVTDFQDLLRYTPNVQYSGGGAGQGNVYMRGLSGGSAGNQSSASVGNFPNVAIYLDDQSMQFPGRNVDIFITDIERVEVLEGPQGTLFGGGAEAGAIRYITNKPKTDRFEGRVEGAYGYTEHGDTNSSFNAMLNVPVIKDKLAVRFVAYSDHQGGYIDSVLSNFTRKDSDNNSNTGISPVNGVCPDGGKPSTNSLFPGTCTSPNFAVYNNQSQVKKAQNPLTHEGMRLSAQWDIAPDWNLLVSESFQNLDAEGISQQYPRGSDGQQLDKLQITAFSPTYDRDNFQNTAWSLNGKIGNFKIVYTGAYMLRYIEQQMDYTNYSRTGSGQYYACTGGATGFGSGPINCYSPITNWHDKARNTHLTQEIRVSTPSDWKLRAVAGAFYEDFQIYDVMNFNYKNIPSCDAGNNLALYNAGLQTCVGNVRTAPGSTAINPGVRPDQTGFGQDLTRGYNQTAFFGQVDYDVLPKLTLTVGARYFQYNEDEKGSRYYTATDCTGKLVCDGDYNNINDEKESAQYNGVKARFGVQYRPTDTFMAYALYSEGFRPGGFSRTSKVTAPYTVNGVTYKQYATPLSYKPDSLRNMEVGFKSQWFDRRLQLNVSAYHMQWQHSQFAIYNPLQLFNNTFLLNGPDYETNGAEAQFVARPLSGLTLTGSLSYNDNRQSNSPCLVANVKTAPDYGQCITVIKGQPFQNPMGVKGGVAAFSPLLQGNLNARYEWDVNDYRAFASLGGGFTSHYFNEPSNYTNGSDANDSPPGTTFLRYRVPSYATVSGSIGVKRDSWTFTLDGSNLLNSHASTYTNTNQFIKEQTPLRPRVIMARVSQSF